MISACISNPEIHVNDAVDNPICQELLKYFTNHELKDLQYTIQKNTYYKGENPEYIVNFSCFNYDVNNVITNIKNETFIIVLARNNEKQMVSQIKHIS